MEGLARSAKLSLARELPSGARHGRVQGAQNSRPRGLFRQLGALSDRAVGCSKTDVENVLHVAYYFFVALRRERIIHAKNKRRRVVGMDHGLKSQEK
jgi:hypothetical protein